MTASGVIPDTEVHDAPTDFSSRPVRPDVALLTGGESADAASLMAAADVTGRTTREKLVSQSVPQAMTVGNKSWADRKMSLGNSAGALLTATFQALHTFRLKGNSLLNREGSLWRQSGRTPRPCRQLRAISGCQRNVRFKPPFSITKMLVS
jgi:hypothetical protein